MASILVQSTATDPTNDENYYSKSNNEKIYGADGGGIGLILQDITT